MQSESPVKAARHDRQTKAPPEWCEKVLKGYHFFKPFNGKNMMQAPL